MVEIRTLTTTGILVLVSSFEAVNWIKPASTFVGYIEKQQQGRRGLLVVYMGQQRTGYGALQ